MTTAATRSAPPPSAGSWSTNTIELRSGTRLGRYELLLPLASGGMAQVWVARQLGDLGFSRVVALKTIRPDRADDHAFRRMFLDEARTASRIRHGHVVEVLDLGEEGAVLFQAMPLIEGDSLSGLLRAQRRQGAAALPPAVLLRVVADAALGLHAAHELRDEEGTPLGLVHRDVSPHNILVGLDGIAKIADFGIAKALGRLLDETAPGQIKGKLAYLAPEQAASQAVDRRADTFALGIVLWEALAGRRLFSADDAARTLHNVLFAPIADPRVYRPDLPEEVARVVARSLCREVEGRFQTAAEMAEAIEEAARQGGLVASAREVAASVERLVGAEVERRRDAVRALSRGAPVEALAVVPDGPASEAPSGAAQPRSPLAAERPAPRPRRLWVLSSIALAVAASGALLAWRAAPGAAASGAPASAPGAREEASAASGAASGSAEAPAAPASEAPQAASAAGAASAAPAASAGAKARAPAGGKKPRGAGSPPAPRFGNPYGR